jgi:hypothetical protein
MVRRWLLRPRRSFRRSFFAARSARVDDAGKFEHVIGNKTVQKDDSGSARACARSRMTTLLFMERNPVTKQSRYER